MSSTDGEVLMQVVSSLGHRVDDGKPLLIEDGVVVLGLGKRSAEKVKRGAIRRSAAALRLRQCRREERRM